MMNTPKKIQPFLTIRRKLRIRRTKRSLRRLIIEQQKLPLHKIRLKRKQSKKKSKKHKKYKNTIFRLAKIYNISLKNSSNKLITQKVFHLKLNHFSNNDSLLHTSKLTS